MAKGHIVVDEARCKGCALCASACPPALVRLDPARLNALGYHPAVLLDPEGRCSGCALCAVICPEAAIRVYRVAAPRAAARAGVAA
jgi:2-oxoglutarate ferredoxin oxidoreductase subunit delta